MDHQSRLQKIIQKPGNKECAECGSKNPRWVSINLGVMFCIQCSGHHRNLGTHISKVKSTTLDKWQDDWLQLFEAIDNTIANEFWEANLPKNQHRPNQNSPSYTTERFLRDKYELQKWKSPNAKNIQEFLESRMAAAQPVAEPVKPPVEQPKPVAQPAPVAAQSVNLLDETPVTAAAPAQQWANFSTPASNDEWATEWQQASPPQKPAPVQAAPPAAVPMFDAAPVQAPPQPQTAMPPVHNAAQAMRNEQQIAAEQQAAHSGKVSAVMNMFNQVPVAPVAQTDQPKTFTPLGAVAAQQLNSNPYGMQQMSMQPGLVHPGMQQMQMQPGMVQPGMQMQMPGMQMQMPQQQMAMNPQMMGYPQQGYYQGQYR